MSDTSAESAPAVRRTGSAEQATLEFARGVHSEAIEFNGHLYTRAQIVLTLNGLALGAVAAGLSSHADDVKDATSVWAWTTWALIAVGGGALIVSVLSSAMALVSRHMQGRIAGDSVDEYGPDTLWFYARIAELDRERFIARALQADGMFEAQTRLTQVAIMAPIMVARANWLNRAFACTALALVSFALATGDWVIRLAH